MKNLHVILIIILICVLVFAYAIFTNDGRRDWKNKYCAICYPGNGYINKKACSYCKGTGRPNAAASKLWDDYKKSGIKSW